MKCHSLGNPSLKTQTRCLLTQISTTCKLTLISSTPRTHTRVPLKLRLPSKETQTPRSLESLTSTLAAATTPGKDVAAAEDAEAVDKVVAFKATMPVHFLAMVATLGGHTMWLWQPKQSRTRPQP